ncbi:acyl-CoA dehydrogenase family protein [Schlesneria paludicola]|uniref:acyl-CoA dehydrogenase family protein n=1 Tax=Schlesneria paludicola TaxID=360056 RepID=UPI00029A187D|nr:acyl-CoA dehydrogenase family protein [Schlesneria paludicola]
MTASETSATALREQQMKQAEELLASLPQRSGVAKGLFRGEFVADWIFPYPQLSSDEQRRTSAALTELRAFCDAELDPAQIDRDADIPRKVIDGLAHLGVLGMTAPESLGGRGFTQLAYCRILEEIGGRCSSTSIFVNAHHSIGMRALLLFGSPEQQKQWLPDLIAGRKLAAFALTEVEAGSDAANVQTTATPTVDGTGYVINGQKRYISNAAIADVLTVMARTPHPSGTGTAVTAFLVSPDMPGFRIIEPRMSKLGIRGTATGRLAFENMIVPRENVLGPAGKGLKVALTVLDFGRTTFGACCTGAAKTCVRLAIDHARNRRQFDRRLADFELVQQKLARMAAWTYGIDAMTTVTAGLIDRGLEDYMLETAMLKVYSTERVWTIVNDAFQIHGGAAYFTDKPLERMLRDARINQIGEGANEVLLSFLALAGMREPGMALKGTWDAMKSPSQAPSAIVNFARKFLHLRWSTPEVPVRAPSLQAAALRIGQLVGRLGIVTQQTLMRHRENVLDRQLEQERIAWAAMEILASLCVLSRRDAELAGNIPDDPTYEALSKLFLDESAANASRQLSLVGHSHDDLIRNAAKAVLTERKSS